LLAVFAAKRQSTPAHAGFSANSNTVDKRKGHDRIPIMPFSVFDRLRAWSSVPPLALPQVLRPEPRHP
jgi:hypothetical protein